MLRLVGCGNVPENVDDAEIAAIRSIVESGLGIRRHEYLNIGTRVRLCSGPLAGTEGLLTGKKKNYRFVVSVGLLQRSISVEVAAEWLEPQSSSPRLPDREGSLDSRVRAA